MGLGLSEGDLFVSDSAIGKMVIEVSGVVDNVVIYTLDIISNVTDNVVFSEVKNDTEEGFAVRVDGFMLTRQEERW